MPKFKTALKTKSQRNDSCIAQYKQEKETRAGIREPRVVVKSQQRRKDSYNCSDYDELKERLWATTRKCDRSNNSGPKGSHPNSKLVSTTKPLQFSAGIMAAVPINGSGDTDGLLSAENSWQALLHDEAASTQSPVTASLEVSRSTATSSKNAFGTLLEVDDDNNTLGGPVLPLFRPATLL
jgi:hypothetical protein